MFPSYVLENLFVKGSLKNTEKGFTFKFKNMIDSGTISGMAPLTIDNTSYDTEKISLKIDGRQIQADQITNRTPLPVYILSEIEFSITGETLDPGPHRMGFSIHTIEAGRLQFSITEPLSE